ncbi:MAG: sulfatase-like hydrolase/transferase [Lachnospiraceae bacterium]|nr:sulfatase-like hydrolase/transferase [Lachnospiraceae bacterium]
MEEREERRKRPSGATSGRTSDRAGAERPKKKKPVSSGTSAFVKKRKPQTEVSGRTRKSASGSTARTGSSARKKNVSASGKKRGNVSREDRLYASKNRKTESRISESGRKTGARRNVPEKRGIVIAEPAFFRSPQYRQIKKYGHLFLMPIVMVYYELILRLLCSGKNRGISFLFFAIAFGFLISGITTFFSRKVNWIVTEICLLVMALYFTVQCMVRSSFQFYMSLSEITTGAGDVVGGFGGTVVVTILAGIPKILLFFWVPVVYLIFARKYLPARRYYYRIGIAVMLAALLLNGLTSFAASHGRYASDYSEDFNFDTSVRTFGLLKSTRLAFKYDLFGNKNKTGFTIAATSDDKSEENAEDTAEAAADTNEDTAETEDSSVKETTVVTGENKMDLEFADTDNEEIEALNEYVSSLTASNKNQYTGLFEGKNLILICLEGFSDAIISEELTPTLYRMQHNGIYFSNYYQPSWGGSTSTGEFSFLTGLAPQDGVETMLEIKDNNNYFTLGNQLQRQNYYNIAYHNGDFNYYDRNLTHESLGYETFLGYMAGHSGDDGYDPDKALEDITGSWADDEGTIATTFQTYKDKTPFSIYFMTISGHAPYKSDSGKVDETWDRVEAYYGDSKSDTVKAFAAYQLHVEDALTRLIADLEEEGLADDTVICMTADHYPYGLEKSEAWGNSEDYVAELYGYDPAHAWEQDRNALFLWSGCLENEYKDYATEISAPTFSLDVVPTLSNLFGLEYDSRLLVGRDVFSDQEAIVFWNSKKFVTEQGMYDIEEDEFYPYDGYERDDDYIDRILAQISNKLNFSKAVIDNDYYGYLFGEDEDVGQAIHGSSTSEDAAEAGLS